MGKWFVEAFDLDWQGRVWVFDGLRAVAALMVFNAHFFWKFNQDRYFAQQVPGVPRLFDILGAGAIGVDLFFVISGFLIFNIVRRTRPAPSDFLARRILRLWPAHAAAIVLVMILPLNLADLLANLTFTAPFFQGVPLMNPVTWTLTQEWLFYLVLLAVAHKVRRDVLVVVATAVGILLVSGVLKVVSRHADLSPAAAAFFANVRGYMDFGRMAGFVIGMALALVIERRSLPGLQASRWAAVAAALAIVLLMAAWPKYAPILLRHRWTSGYYIACAACFAIIMFHMLRAPDGAVGRLLATKPVQFFGRISYSFYLVHLLLLDRMPALGVRVTSLGGVCAAYVVMLAVATLAAAVLYVHFERPYLRALARRKRPSVTARGMAPAEASAAP